MKMKTGTVKNMLKNLTNNNNVWAFQCSKKIFVITFYWSSKKLINICEYEWVSI